MNDNPGALPIQLGTRRPNVYLAYLVINGRMIPPCHECNGFHVAAGFRAHDHLQFITSAGERIELALTERAPYEDFYDGAHWEAFDLSGRCWYWRERKDVEAMQQ